MKIQRPRKSSTVMVPIASMGDIAFLLIIFFVLVSYFRDSKVKVTPPTSPDIERLDRTPPISVIMGSEGGVFINGQEVSLGEVEGTVAGMIAGKTDPQARRVLVKIDEKLPERRFKPLLIALSKAGAQTVLAGQLKKEP